MKKSIKMLMAIVLISGGVFNSTRCNIVKKISVPTPKGASSYDVDLTTTEDIITFDTLQEAMTRKYNLGLPFILAVGLYVDSAGKLWLRYFDATSILGMVKQNGYNNLKDPSSRMPFVSILFYIIDSKNPEFKLLCASENLWQPRTGTEINPTYHKLLEAYTQNKKENFNTYKKALPPLK